MGVLLDVLASIPLVLANVLGGLTKEHIFGAVFIAYIVIKEVFVYLRGETKTMSDKVNSMGVQLMELSTIIKDFKEVEKPIEDLHNTVLQCSDMFPQLREQLKRMDDMYLWHSKEDSDGVKVWYLRTSLEKTLDRLSDTLTKQNELIGAAVERIASLGTQLANYNKKDQK
jgi:hypothetical protein